MLLRQAGIGRVEHRRDLRDGDRDDTIDVVNDQITESNGSPTTTRTPRGVLVRAEDGVVAREYREPELLLLGSVARVAVDEQAGDAAGLSGDREDLAPVAVLATAPVGYEH